jgi:pyridoxine 5-phosphate synthase
VPVQAVAICERAGADGITAHLREDRRHIQDADIDAIAAAVTTVFNLEIACTAEMLALAERLRPHQVTLVPERREEVTTEGRLAIAPAADALRGRPRAAAERGNPEQPVHRSGSGQCVPLARSRGRRRRAAHRALRARAGQGPPSTLFVTRRRSARRLDWRFMPDTALPRGNVGPVAAIQEIEELKHRTPRDLTGDLRRLDAAVRELRAAMDAPDARPNFVTWPSLAHQIGAGMTAPAGFLDFFVLEAGEYIEQLDAMILAAGNVGPISTRSSARAGPPRQRHHGQAPRVRRDGGGDRAGRDTASQRCHALGARARRRLVAAVDDCKLLLRNVRSWSPADEARGRGPGSTS